MGPSEIDGQWIKKTHPQPPSFTTIDLTTPSGGSIVDAKFVKKEVKLNSQSTALAVLSQIFDKCSLQYVTFCLKSFGL